MESNLFWLIVSFAYIGTLALLGFVFYQCLRMHSESVRKFIHILTSLWIFIVLYKMSNPIMMLLGPFLFIFFNSAFVYCGFGKYLGMSDRKRNNGLIYYPLSIFILVLLYIKGVVVRENVVCGVLIMGFGDGLAAVVGTLIGRHRYAVFDKYKKSLEGTLTMLVVSLVVLLIFSNRPIYQCIIVAIVAALLENMTPFGFDNVSVPIISALLLEMLCRL